MATILLIDYDPRNIKRVRSLLEGCGHAVAVARDGVDGLDALDRLGPDLTLVEALLPKKHGFDVCREVKRSPQGKYVPVVLITSRFSARNHELRLIGCDGHLMKPFTDEALLAEVRRFAGNGTKPSRDRQQPAEVTRTQRPPKAPAVPRMPSTVPVEFDESELSDHLDSLLSSIGDAPRTEAKPEETPAGNGDSFPTVEKATKAKPAGRSSRKKKPAGDSSAKNKKKRKTAKGKATTKRAARSRLRRRRQEAVPA